MARYLVGNGNDTWRFNDAYNAAKDGDTIELQGGCNLSGVFEIKKNISIIGTTEKKEDGKGYWFKNGLYGRFIIKGGVTVSISDLWICLQEEKITPLYVTEKSTLMLKHVYFENELDDNKNTNYYFCSDKESTVKMESVFSRKNIAHFLFTEQSQVSIRDSELSAAVRVKGRSKLDIENSFITSHRENVLNIQEASIVNLKRLRINAEKLNKDFPAIYVKNSTLNSVNSVVNQPSSAAVGAINGYISSYNDILPSLYISQSMVRAFNLTIRSKVYVYMGFIKSEGVLNFLGELDQEVDCLLTNGSTAIFKDVKCYRSAYPNMKVEDNSFLYIGAKALENGFVEDINEEIAEDSIFIDAEKINTEAVVDTSIISKERVNTNKNELLNNLVGLTKVKKEINKMLKLVEFNKQRIAQGLKPEKQSLHAVFTGNPGTGKTTVARLIGEILFENSVLPGEEFIFVEATESDLISSNVGGSAEQTTALLERARGGILFIDEAYTLNKKDASVNFGQEVINTILKYMEDYRDEIMIIFAGYTKEMEQFLKTNPGLASRVPNKFIFEDYTSDEIIQIGKNILLEGQYNLEDVSYYEKKVAQAYNNSLDHSNGRWIRNFNEQLFRALADRVIDEGSNDVITIKNVDIDEVLNKGKFVEGENQFNAWEELNRLIGIKSVKQQVQQFIDLAEMNKKREEQGQIVSDTTLHALYLGNPGTGKTTVARIVGEILYQKGIISQKRFVEVSRSDLVGAYVGHTALKTREVLESALGGVLFIDEAYTLSNGSGNDFGKEAIEEILKFMEDHRRDIVIIFAGYTKEMSEFLQMNSGLTSRIPNVFNFEDYSPAEIVDIGLLVLNKQGYVVDELAYSQAVKEIYQRSSDNSNGRWVRNLNERLIRYMSSRVAKQNSNDLSTITQEDLQKLEEV